MLQYFNGTCFSAILGMHTMMNTDQFYSSLKETKIANKTGFSSLTKCELQVLHATVLFACNNLLPLYQMLTNFASVYHTNTKLDMSCNH